MHEFDLAPTGTVTLVFTDIQGSTMLWERFKSSFKALLDLHNQLVRDAIAKHNGYEVKTEGDAFMVAFSQATDAVFFCLEAQEVLHQAAWPNELLEPADLKHVAGETEDGAFRGLRVRMGIHTGEPRCERDPLSGRMDYFGTVVNRAARVGHIGHGGQVIVSETTFSQVQDRLGSAMVKDLGAVPLKGLERPENLTQLLPQTLASRKFPSLSGPNLITSNLPPQLDSFVGRDAELVNLGDLIRDGARLVTLLGSAGTGKTRLAIQYGNENIRSYSGGVWFCDLTEARSVEGICKSIAHALGIGVRSGDPVDSIAKALRERSNQLLILDNFEQISRFANETIGKWLHESPTTHIMVTSRERLQVEGENIFPVDPLTQSEAVQLFVDRAKAVQNDFSLNAENQKSIIEIVERLDRMSLAIELAAARTTILSPKKILERLSQRFKLLRGERRNVQERQATLHNAIDWSWHLLEPWEKLALAQISLFHGGFTLEAAEDVVSIDDWNDAPWVIDVLQALCDKSLLRVRESVPGHDRFFLYESIREYATAQHLDADAVRNEVGESLTGPEGLDDTAQRMAHHYSQYGTLEYRTSLRTHGGVNSLRLLQLELDNLLTSMHRCIATKNPELAANILFSVCDVLAHTGPCLLAAECCQLVLKQVELSHEHHTRVLIEQSRSLRMSGQMSRARISAKWALAKAQEINDITLQATAHAEKALLHSRCGEGEEALKNQEEALNLHRQAGNRTAEGGCLSNLGVSYRRRGEFDKAQQFYEQALAIHREVGNRPDQAVMLNNLANLYKRENRLKEARAYLQEAIDICDECGNHRDRCIMLGNLGDVYLQVDLLDKAQEYLESSVELARNVGLRGPEGAFNGSLGELFIKRGEFGKARVHIKDGEAILRELGDLSELLKVIFRKAQLAIAETNIPEGKQAVLDMRELAQATSLQASSPVWKTIEDYTAKITAL
ncbi:MAG: tetratricopeptide repeat protein [Deltaproteobacteria bacterium]|nr:tetratricopeptide repeat protein [Deltaproteobacteria bacterium]